MSPSSILLTDQMQALIQQWEQAEDHRALFLQCYLLMTKNVIEAISTQEFNDPAWVDRVMEHFADYYFVALQAYERDPASAPKVWQLAHNAARDPKVSPLQKMLVGINAHVNYDLVLNMAELLRPEWNTYSEQQRLSRYIDHCRINDVIARTVDAVQDQVLDPAMPIIGVIDKLLGPVDELMLSHLIAHWRDSVWHHTTRLLETSDAEEQAQLISQIEKSALETGEFICLGNDDVSLPGQ
jgi:Family of unknown function (DUF5995)